MKKPASQTMAVHPNAPAPLLLSLVRGSTPHLITGLGLLFLLWATYNRGLLFAFDQRFGAFPLLLLGTYVVWRHGLPFTWRRPSVIALLVYASGYVLSLPFAATPVEAVPGFVYYAGAAGFCFVLGAWAGRTPRALGAFADVLAIVAGTASWFGFLAMVKWVILQDAYTGRLGSTLQYANAYAILCAMGILASVGVGTARRNMTWRHLTLFASFLGLFLSVSRGGILVAVIVVAAYAAVTFWTLPQLTMVLAVHGAVAAYTYGRLGPMIGQAPASSVMLILLAATAAATVVGWLLEVGIRSLNLSRRTIKLVAVLLMALAAVTISVYGGHLVSRLSSLVDLSSTTDLNTSDLSRVQHLKDAARIMLDHPLGVGTRGWWVLYPQYQPFRYVINVAHSHWAETAVAAGVLGLLGLVASWLVLGVNYARKMFAPGITPAWHAVFWSLAALGLHSSVIDADMNFLMFSFIAFFGFGLMETAGQDSPRLARQSLWLRGGLAALSILLLVPLATFLLSDILNNRAMTFAIANKVREAQELLETASRLNPTQPIVHINAAKLSSSQAVGDQTDRYLEQARVHMARAVAVDPYRSDFRVDYAVLLAELGELELARAELEKAVSLAPWQIRFWEKLLEFHIESARAFGEAGDTARYQEHLTGGRDVLRRIAEQEAKRPNQSGALGLEFDSARFKDLKGQLEKL